MHCIAAAAATTMMEMVWLWYCYDSVDSIIISSTPPTLHSPTHPRYYYYLLSSSWHCLSASLQSMTMKTQKEAKSKKRQHHPAIKIKGYLPIRVSLPTSDTNNGAHSYTSFIYIKEHNQKSQPGSSGSGGDLSSVGGGAGATLFIANAPTNGPLRTDLFLRALFEPYGNIQRVTVTQDPRKVGSLTTGGGEGEDALETFREAAVMGLDADVGGGASERKKGDGKFAHVVFTSGKEMKNALKRLTKEISDAEDVFIMQLDEERKEQLVAETTQLEANHEDDDDEAQNNSESSLTGIHAVAAQARRKACRHISRQKLMQMCNDAMALFESEEEKAAQRAKLAGEQPDEDGFITVVHKSAPAFGATNDLEEEQYHRRKAGKRNRKRKAGSGAEELPDFYRFQLKETRKNEVQDLKKRFEEDLAKVRKMKEERAFRPFS